MSLASKVAVALGPVVGPVIAKVFLQRRQLFDLWQRLGVHVVPNHFYEPVADTRTLEASRFTNASAMPGVDLRVSEQVKLMREMRARFGAEYDAFVDEAVPGAPGHAFHLDNGMYGPVDAEVLYSLVRMHKPARVIEIGSGHSTKVTAMALLANQRESGGKLGELTCIEPYPRAWLKQGFPGLTRLIEKRAEEVPLEMFSGLGPGDMLFIDSSHVLKIGSDVQYEFLEIVPRVGVGALVHVHDIFFPKEYPRWWVMEEHRFWTEQYLLQAFLAFNRAFEVVWCGTAVDHAHRTELEAAFPSLARWRKNKGAERVGPASFWMRRVGE